MTLEEILIMKPYALSFNQKVILHYKFIDFNEEDIIEFANKYPDAYQTIKDIIPIEKKTQEVTLMNKLMMRGSL